MQKDTLIKLFKRDLTTLKEEIGLYKNEANLWSIDGSITNSAGNLCLHIIGNLNHFIGATLGETGYVRQRDLEFSQKNVAKPELIEQIDATSNMIENVLTKLTEIELRQEYNHRVFKEPMTTEYFLSHLAMHLAYHLGQINYHRRLLDRN